jgi:glucosamine--fructose-6-phosphate aminotransferase (isomerizing)
VCGIIGYTGTRPCRELILEGLERLEYRGYDSAGLALTANGEVDAVHAVGNLSHLREAVSAQDERGAVTVATDATTGIGHTRWATHGRVTHENAHPHWDTSGRVHIVLNGIVENWSELRRQLQDDGAEFTSETDAEVVAHLVSKHLNGDLTEAVRQAYLELRGHYAFVAMSADHPGVLVGARKECPLVVGLGDEEAFIASAIPAFLAHTRQVQIVEDDDIVAVTAEGSRFLDVAGNEVERPIQEVDWDEDAAEKGGFDTFMLKEIHEQPAALAETVLDRIREGTVDLGEIGISDDQLANLRRVLVVACGTAYHAGVVARYAIEEWSGVHVGVDIASEFRYRKPLFDERDLVIGISQSGETADTLAAMRLARESGARVLAVTNTMGSQATRDSDGTLFTRAGLEIGVAATKTFVAQIAVMYLFGLKLAQVRGTLSEDEVRKLTGQLREMPHQMERLIDPTSELVGQLAQRWKNSSFFLFMGRHIGLPVALEGALKMKEISYIPSDAYAAGEMKHGPIALLDERTPVLAVATHSPVLDKLLSNIAEVRARGAPVAAVATEGDHQVAEHTDEVLYVPETDWLLQPLLAVVPLQLLAYYIARARGLNVDQPRNLAKTVTVE